MTFMTFNAGYYQFHGGNGSKFASVLVNKKKPRAMDNQYLFDIGRLPSECDTDNRYNSHDNKNNAIVTLTKTIKSID